MEINLNKNHLGNLAHFMDSRNLGPVINGEVLSNPFWDDTGRCSVDPLEHWGPSFYQWLAYALSLENAPDEKYSVRGTYMREVLTKYPFLRVVGTGGGCEAIECPAADGSLFVLTVNSGCPDYPEENDDLCFARYPSGVEWMEGEWEPEWEANQGFDAGQCIEFMVRNSAAMAELDSKDEAVREGLCDAFERICERFDLSKEHCAEDLLLNPSLSDDAKSALTDFVDLWNHFV